MASLLQFLTFASLLAQATPICASSSVVKGIYWFENTLFPPSAINTSLFTHVYYAFLAPNNTTYELNVSKTTATSLTTFTNTLRTQNPPVKTLLSIGGSDFNETLFALIVSNFTTRATFINSTINVARTFGFDGVDLDWEYPQNANEMNNLGQLLQEWRVAITADAADTRKPPLLLTAAVYFAVEFFLTRTPQTYPVGSINQNVDWVNVMSYDFHGSWSNDTGAPAGLFDPVRNVSVVAGLMTWIRGGADPRKMVMGVPLFGRTWTLQDPNVHGIGAPIVGVGPGAFGVNGSLMFFKVLQLNEQTGAEVVHDVDTVSVYSYSGNTWVGYDDPFTVTTKIAFAQALSLRGYFFWAAGFDTSDWKISTQGKQQYYVID